jgi:hypothetical protein
MAGSGVLWLIANRSVRIEFFEQHCRWLSTQLVVVTVNEDPAGLGIQL